jgi:hypothetical protein
LATKHVQLAPEGEVLQFQNRPATESARKNGNDWTHESEHVRDIKPVNPQTLDFSLCAAFLVATVSKGIKGLIADPVGGRAVDAVEVCNANPIEIVNHFARWSTAGIYAEAAAPLLSPVPREVLRRRRWCEFGSANYLVAKPAIWL